MCQNRCYKLKWKCNEEDPDAAEPDTTISIEQFTSTLHERAFRGDICCWMHVSTQGMAGEEAEVIRVIVGCMWEATGF